MNKICGAFPLLACLGVFLVSPVHAAEPVRAAKPAHAAKKEIPTLSTLKKDMDELQRQMAALVQLQSAILRVLEQQQADQSVKMNKPESYSYP